MCIRTFDLEFTKKINLQYNRIFAEKKLYYVKNIYQLVKKLFNRVILSKYEVFGKFFVNKAETKNGMEKSLPRRHKLPPALWQEKVRRFCR